MVKDKIYRLIDVHKKLATYKHSLKQEQHDDDQFCGLFFFLLIFLNRYHNCFSSFQIICLLEPINHAQMMFYGDSIVGIAHIHYQNTATRIFWVIVARCGSVCVFKAFFWVGVARCGSVWIGVARCGSVCISRATLGRCGSVWVGVGRCVYLKHFSGSVWLGVARCGWLWAGVYFDNARY